MNWHQYVEWTDTTAKPEGDVWESMREGLIEECHEALSVWHQIKAIEHGAVKRLHRDGPPNPMQLEVRQTRLDRLRRQLVEEVGDACWYAARIQRRRRVTFEPKVYDVSTPAIRISYQMEQVGECFHNDRSAEVAVLIEVMCEAFGVTLPDALANNEAKLTARKAAGTIPGEGER